MSQEPALSTLPPPQSRSTRPTRVRYAVLGWACALAIITYLQRAGFGANLTELRRDLGLGQGDVGWLTASFMIAYGLFEVPWGAAADRRGARTILAVIAVGASVLTAAVALTGPLRVSWVLALGVIVVLRFAFGAFQAGIFPSLSRVMADWMPITERGSAQGFIWMSSRIGGFLAPIVMTAIYRWSGSWQWPLVIAAAVGILWAVGFRPWFRNHPNEMPGVNEAEIGVISAGRAPKRKVESHAVPWGLMLRAPNVLFLCAMYGCLAYSGNFFLFMLNDYLKTQRQVTADQAMWLTALPFGCGVFACVGGGMLSDRIIRASGHRRWGRRIVGAAGLTLAAVCITITPFVTDLILLGFLYCLTFIGNDLAMGPSWAAASEIGERHAGTVGGAMNMIGSFAAAIAAIVAARLFKNDYVQLPFVLFGAAYILGALCWLGVDVTRPLVVEPQGLPGDGEMLD